jgi:hypothetical protein
MSYTVKLDHFLSDAELRQLFADHMPSLLALNARYTNHIDPVNSYPLTPIYVDYLRTTWRLDTSQSRPPENVAAAGLGLAFGLLLAACTELRWAIATDDGGQFLTMAKEAGDSALVSVPPFSYVQKRQNVENAEVFQHFFEQVPPEQIGFCKPSNWLLHGEA